MGGVHVLTDPLLRGRVGPLRWYGPLPPARLAETADALVISHLHRDHLDRGSLARVPGTTPILVPRGARAVLPRAARQQAVEMTAGDSYPLGAVDVRAVPAAHPATRGPWAVGPRADPLGYVLDGSRSIYFAGDSGLFDGMRAIGPNLDLGLLPIGGWGLTLGPEHLDP